MNFGGGGMLGLECNYVCVTVDLFFSMCTRQSILKKFDTFTIGLNT